MITKFRRFSGKKSQKFRLFWVKNHKIPVRLVRILLIAVLFLDKYLRKTIVNIVQNDGVRFIFGDEIRYEAVEFVDLQKESYHPTLA